MHLPMYLPNYGHECIYMEETMFNSTTSYYVISYQSLSYFLYRIPIKKKEKKKELWNIWAATHSLSFIHSYFSLCLYLQVALVIVFLSYS